MITENPLGGGVESFSLLTGMRILGVVESC